MTTTTLPIAALRAATARLLDEVEKKLGSEVLLEDDFYWNVLGEAPDMHGEPRLDLGSVVDDAESVCDFAAQGRDELVSIWHECEHIAGVLRSIARLDLTD